jgi:hypothetical protein
MVILEMVSLSAIIKFAAIIMLDLKGSHTDLRNSRIAFLSSFPFSGRGETQKELL